MPFKDPQRAREYQRTYRRTNRTGRDVAGGTAVDLPVPTALRTSAAVIEVLEEQVAVIRGDTTLSPAERARTIGYLCSVTLRAIESRNLQARVEELERVLKLRESPTS